MNLLLEAINDVQIEYIINNYAFEIFIVLTGLILVAYIFIFIQSIRISRLKIKYNSMISEIGGGNIEEMLIYNKKEVNNIKDINKGINVELNDINEELRKAYTKSAIYKYNAFDGMGGELSFVYIMVNNKNTGIILNGIYSQEGHYLYLKEVIEGKCDKELSKEEKETLEKVLK